MRLFKKEVAHEKQTLPHHIHSISQDDHQSVARRLQCLRKVFPNLLSGDTNHGIFHEINSFASKEFNSICLEKSFERDVALLRAGSNA